MGAIPEHLRIRQEQRTQITDGARVLFDAATQRNIPGLQLGRDEGMGADLVFYRGQEVARRGRYSVSLQAPTPNGDTVVALTMGPEEHVTAPDNYFSVRNGQSQRAASAEAVLINLALFRSNLRIPIWPTDQ